MKTSKLLTKIGMPALAGFMLVNSYGCAKTDEEINKMLKNYCGIKKVEVRTSDGYDKYAFQLKKENQQFENIDYDILREFLKNDPGLKNKKMLQGNGVIKLPVYNCGGFIKKPENSKEKEIESFLQDLLIVLFH